MIEPKIILKNIHNKIFNANPNSYASDQVSFQAKFTRNEYYFHLYFCPGTGGKMNNFET